jgi:NAD(P)-dependent dehydrogenase (short-subunit alcohol dehydrogenase family)
MYADDLFEGEVALVTGAGRGIGKDISLKLAELGADVAVNDLYEETASETVAEIRDLGQDAVAVAGDVSDPDDVEAMVATAEDELGLVRRVVNNAGSNNDDDLVDLAYEEWQKTMAINADGTFLVSREVAGRLIDEGESGAIANISSIAGLGPQPGAGAYSPSKAAVVMLSEQMALEWAEEEVRVNAIAPGLIWTPATDNVYSDDELLAKRKEWTPSKQIGEPADVTRTAIYLLAPENRYTSGETAVVDAAASKVGLSMIPGRSQHE